MVGVIMVSSMEGTVELVETPHKAGIMAGIMMGVYIMEVVGIMEEAETVERVVETMEEAGAIMEAEVEAETAEAEAEEEIVAAEVVMVEDVERAHC